MAFKRTSGRRVFTQPNGMPDLSGFAKAGQIMSEIGQMTYNISSDIRKTKLNKLILEAESQGRTAGATYDEENNLVPLTNLDISKDIEDQVFGSSDKEALRLAYKNAAIKTYASSVKSSAKAYAENLLLENLDDPDSIRGGLAGYLEGVADDEEVAGYVKPLVVHEFVIAENKAKANLKIKQDKITEKENLSNVSDNVNKLSTIINKGPSPDDVGSVGQNKMISELMEDIEGSFDALKTIGYDEVDIEEIRDQNDSFLAQSAMQSHVTKFYEASGFSEAETLEEIYRISDSMASMSESSTAEVQTAMSNELIKLKKAHTAKVSEETTERQQNFEDAQLAIAIGGLTDRNAVLSLDVDNDQKVSLLSKLSTVQTGIITQKKAVQTAIDDLNKERFDLLMLPFKDEFGDPKEREANSIIIESMFVNKQIDAVQYDQYTQKSNDIVKKDIKGRANANWALIDSQLSGPPIIEVSTLKNEIIPKIRKNGLIGTDSTLGQKTETEVQNIIETYETRRKRYLEENRKISSAISRRKNGDFTNPQDAKLIAEQKAFKLQADDEGNTLYHSDPVIQEQNMERAVQFTLLYNVLHPEVESSLKGLGSVGDNIEAFNTKLKLFDSIFTSISNGSYKKGQTDFRMGDLNAIALLESQGIDVNEYQSAKMEGFVKFKEMKGIKESDNADRITRNIASQFGSVREGIEANFSEAMAGSGYIEWLGRIAFGGNDLDTQMDKIIDNLRASVPSRLINSGEVDDAIIGDERLYQMIENSVMRQFATKKLPVNPENMQNAIRRAVALDIGSTMGISVDSEGAPYWSASPWYKKASESIGDSLNLVPESVSDIVFQDAKFKALNLPGGGLFSERVRGLLEEDGVLTLEPNILSGKSQTYRLIVSDPDNPFESYTVLPSYNFDWSTSVGNAVSQAAQKRIKNSTLRDFISNSWGIGDFANKSFVNKQIENILGDLKNDAGLIGVGEPEGWTGLMEVLQSISSDINPFYDKFTDQTYDVGDVKILRDYMNGNYATNEEYLKALDEYYE